MVYGICDKQDAFLFNSRVTGPHAAADKRDPDDRKNEESNQMRCYDEDSVGFELREVIIEEDGLHVSVTHVCVLIDVGLALGDLAACVVGRVVVAYFATQCVPSSGDMGI